MSEKDLNFEESIEQLNKIADDLEKGEIDLETSVKKFEEGMELAKKCNKILENAEKRITMLIKKEDEIIEEDFKYEE